MLDVVMGKFEMVELARNQRAGGGVLFIKLGRDKEGEDGGGEFDSFTS
jgi:hypothetical protein